MSYQDRDWYDKWRKEQEAAERAPFNPYLEALKRASKFKNSGHSPRFWHWPSLAMGAFSAFLFMFLLNGFRFWF